jgi:hypothetical protein
MGLIGKTLVNHTIPCGLRTAAPLNNQTKVSKISNMYMPEYVKRVISGG